MYTAILADARTDIFELFDRHSSVVQFGGVLGLVLDLLNLRTLVRSTSLARVRVNTAPIVLWTLIHSTTWTDLHQKMVVMRSVKAKPPVQDLITCLLI